MRNIYLSATIFTISLFMMACGTIQPPQTAQVDPYVNNAPVQEPVNDDDYWAKDNLDLQRVGNLFERSNSPEEFERYLNTRDGINNLDLNGDNYVDYISVREYEDRGDNERGLSLFSRFGPDLIQEIATIILYRDDVRSPGARLLLTGNDQLYGDNNYYETNWTDRSIGLVSRLFGNRDTQYTSPYYYDNYPSDYRAYEVVGTPFYSSRVEQLYPQPEFVYTTSPTFISKIKIKSPNNGLHLGQIHAKLVKPTKDQAEFLKNNPGRPKLDKIDKDDKDKKTEGPAKADKQPKDERKVDSKEDKPSKPAKAEKPEMKSVKPDGGKSGDGGKGGGKGKKP